MQINSLAYRVCRKDRCYDFSVIRVLTPAIRIYFEVVYLKVVLTGKRTETITRTESKTGTEKLIPKEVRIGSG